MRAEDHTFNVCIKELQEQVKWLEECVRKLSEESGIVLPPSPEEQSWKE